MHVSRLRAPPTRRGPRQLLIACALLALPGCFTDALWYRPGPLAFDLPQRKIESTWTRTITPQSLQAARFAAEQRLDLDVAYSDGTVRRFHYEASPEDPSFGPSLQPIGFEPGEPRDRAWSSLNLADLRLVLRADDTTRVDVLRGDEAVGSLHVPSDSRVESNPAWVFAILATPFAVALDVATLPLQVLFVLGLAIFAF